MRSLLLLLALALPGITSPIPQDIQGNQQIELQNVSPTPSLDAVPVRTGTPSIDNPSTETPSTISDISGPNTTGAPEPAPEPAKVDPALQALAKPPKITADDGMRTGMDAAMSGLGSVTSGLSSLPVVGGLGSRDAPVSKRWAMLDSLPVLGPLMGSGLFGRIKRQLWPTLANMPDMQGSDKMPDMGSSGFINLGHKKRQANQLLPATAPGGLWSKKDKRQLPGLDGLGGILGLLGGLGAGRKAKRGPAFEALGEVPGIATTLLSAFGKPGKRENLPIVGDLVGKVTGGLGGGLPGLSPRAELPIKKVKDMVKVVADIRGVTSKREAEAAPEQGDFRQGLRKSADATVDGALDRAEGKAERKAKSKVKDEKIPGQGALPSKREAEAEALGLDALPAKDIIEGAAGIKSTMDLVKNLSSQVEQRNGK